MKTESSPLAGKTINIKQEANHIGGQQITIEDYWHLVSGKSWKVSNGNPAAINYSMRTSLAAFKVPLDDEVLYGKIGGLGYLVHVSELNTDSIN